MHDRQGGIAFGCGPVPSGCAFKIAGPGCRSQRHSSGTWECARTQRLDQRSERHRQCGQSTGDTAAGHKPGSHTHLIPSCGWLPNVPSATSRQDETNATCGIQISSPGKPSGRQGAGQAAQRQDSKHLQGMLILGLACWMANTFPKAQYGARASPLPRGWLSVMKRSDRMRRHDAAV
jgi:hypothetical protein